MHHEHHGNCCPEEHHHEHDVYAAHEHAHTRLRLGQACCAGACQHPEHQYAMAHQFDNELSDEPELEMTKTKKKRKKVGMGMLRAYSLAA
jgi:phage regulator Rha-like protein